MATCNGTCKSHLCYFFIPLESKQLISDHLVRHTLGFAPNYSLSHLVVLKERKKNMAGLLSLFINMSREVRHLLTVSPVNWI